MPLAGENDMANGGEHQPGIAMGARGYGPRRGRRPGTGAGLPGPAGRRSAYGYVVASLAVLALLGAWSLGVAGCTAQGSGYARMGEPSGSVLANARQSPGEISRLARNARYFKLMGQPELGLKELEQAHRQNPDNLQIVNLLAQNYEELGKFEAARQLYQEALTRQGSNPVIANNLCFSYYQEGRWQEAETCFRQTLAHDPRNQAARNNLGLLYCRLGRQDEARRLWQEAEGAAAADLKVSQALAALGMPDRAVYARKPKAAPAAAKATPAPTPRAAVSPVAAPKPAKENTPVQPVARKESAKPLAAKPRTPTPAPKATTPAPPVAPQEPAKPVATKPPAPTPGLKALAPAPGLKAVATTPPVATKEAVKPVAAKPTAPAPGPVAAKPRQEPRKPAAVPPPAHPAGTPGPAAQAATRPSPKPSPLTAVELAETAIEVRNGTWTKNLAHQTRTLLRQEGFTVAKIGNHVDFGAAKTIIYYRPGAETVARALADKVFPGAALAPSDKLKKGMDIKVLLGHDLVENPQFMARLHQGPPPAAPRAQTPLATAKLLNAKTEVERPAASHQEPAKVSPAKPGPQTQAVPPKSKEVAAAPLPSPGSSPLTAAELVGTAIEIRNGTWTKNLAHQTRSLLREEGFTVAKIGNHVDFGATKTVIYYRLGAERVARAVADKFFPRAALTPSLKLKKGMDVKILLGADLLQRPQLMARLVAEGK
jgi:Flp pilus assembly protein TadD